MKWKKANDSSPVDDVDVHVVTGTGLRGIAKYWSLTGKWLTADKRFTAKDVVVKWKYADAT